MSMHEHTCSYTFHMLIKSPPILTGSVRWKNPLLLQDFLECYFISSIIYKNPKKIKKKFKIQKNTFLDSTASFHKNRFHWVNTGPTKSTRVKNEFQAVSGQNRHFRSKSSPPSQYGSNHVNQEIKWVSGRFGSKLSFSVKTKITESIRVRIKNKFSVILGQNCYVLSQLDSPSWYQSKNIFDVSK